MYTRSATRREYVEEIRSMTVHKCADTRLLFVISSLKRCGPVNQLYELIRNLDRSSFDVTVLTLKGEVDGNSRIADFSDMGVRLLSLGLTRWHVANVLVRMHTVLTSIQPHVVHSHGLLPDLAVSLVNTSAVHVCTIHSYCREDYVFSFGPCVGSLLSRVHLSILRRIEFPIACSSSVARKLEESHRLRVGVIWNGINTDVYAPVSDREKAHLRRTLGLPIDARIFIYTGKLSPLKNPMFLVQAFAAADLVGCLLLLIGDGPLREACAEQGVDSVLVTGQVDNVQDYLRASDVYVSSSTTEGMPLGVLEAMACGLPVLLSDIAAHRELVEGTPNVQGLFSLNDQQSLISLMGAYAREDLEEIGRSSRQKIDTSFSAELMASSYQTLYRDALASRRRKGQ